MAFCGVLAQKGVKKPLFAVFYRIYIIEAHNFYST